MRKPTKTLAQFEAETRSLDLRFRQHRITQRGRDCINDQMRKALELRSAKEMKAVNPITRIAFCRAITQKLKSWFRENKISTFYFVTLISSDHAMLLSNAQGRDLNAQRKWIKSELDGLDYFGMIDAAFYREAPFTSAPEEPWVSWHAHLIVWNASAKQIEQLRNAVNRRYEAFRPNAPAFHASCDSIDRLEERVAYICKLPMSEYNSWETLATAGIDKATNKRLMRPTGRISQNKRQLRLGNFAELLAAMGPDLRLSMLAISGGEGLNLKLQALKRARSRLELNELERDTKLREALCRPQGNAAVSRKQVHAGPGL